MEFASSHAYVPENEEDVQEEEAVLDDAEELSLAAHMDEDRAHDYFASPLAAGLESASAGAPPPPPHAPAPVSAPPASGLRSWLPGLFGSSAAPAHHAPAAATPAYAPTSAAFAPAAPGRAGRVHFAQPSAPAQKSMPRRVVRQEMDTNVVSFKCSQLATDVPIHTGDVFLCPTCHVAFSTASKTEQRGPGKLVWKCEFCDTETDLPLAPEEFPVADSVDYILKPAPAVAAQVDETRIIFVVDISGSMCVSVPVEGKHVVRGGSKKGFEDEVRAHGLGSQLLPGERQNTTYFSRLQSVQAAVDHQLQNMSRLHPHRRVGLIAFNNEVCIVGDGTTAPVTLAGPTLSNAAALRQAALEFAGVNHPISGTAKALSQKLFALEESSSTALGPALLVGVTIACQVRGSKVMVCTDGLANVGIGSLESYDTMPEAEQQAVDGFYDTIAAQAQEAGVSVSVISIIGEECKLDRLSRLADTTGGDVERVSPLSLMDNFINIMENPVLATKVSATMYLHKGLYFRNADADPTQSQFTVNLGNVNAESEAFYDFGVRREYLTKRSAAAAASPATTTTTTATTTTTGTATAEADGAAASAAASAAAAPAPAAAAAAAAAGTLPKLAMLPFQLQVRFTKLDGMECVRVITRMQPVTTKAPEAKKDLNVPMFAAWSAQQSSRLAEKGQHYESRAYARNATTMMHRDYLGSAQPMQQQAAALGIGYMGELESAARSSQYRSAEPASRGRTTRSDEEAVRMHKAKKATSKFFGSPAVSTPHSSAAAPHPPVPPHPSTLVPPIVRPPHPPAAPAHPLPPPFHGHPPGPPAPPAPPV